MKNVLEVFAILLFTLTGVMTYAFVFDVEPLSPEKCYNLERDIYMHSDQGLHNDFPSFNDWMNCRDEQEHRFNEWLAGISTQIGLEAAITFDPWYVYQDTSTGHAGAAPDNWAKGERD